MQQRPIGLREVPVRVFVGATENAGVENAGVGIAGVENAGVA